MVIKAIPPAALSLSDPTTTLQTYLESLSRPLYIIFIASPDPATDAPWCPDVRAALPIFNRVFEESEEELSVVTVQVGDKPAWKDANNVFRREWGISAIPTVGKYSVIDVDGQSIVAVRMLVENDCADEDKLRAFIN
ncbi:uncharacterized protein DFL_000154 [Arthrobotrys flagrans]|uniref:Thioredoxin domain-containing protein n=1 Tax=Arthrobotrys flagrans TaxID=97331 RepID=A0A437AD48_ARTFL|nr:hypothetical protein DFL_000154 [Arthrobotrys flagrans]